MDKVERRARRPLTSSVCYAGYTLAVDYNGEEVAITASTKQHLRLVFKRLFPDNSFNEDKVCRVMIVPEKMP